MELKAGASVHRHTVSGTVLYGAGPGDEVRRHARRRGRLRAADRGRHKTSAPSHDMQLGTLTLVRLRYARYFCTGESDTALLYERHFVAPPPRL